MKSGIELIKGAGGTVAQAFCLIELVELKGAQALSDGSDFFSVLKFEV